MRNLVFPLSIIAGVAIARFAPVSLFILFASAMTLLVLSTWMQSQWRRVFLVVLLFFAGMLRGNMTVENTLTVPLGVSQRGIVLEVAPSRGGRAQTVTVKRYGDRQHLRVVVPLLPALSYGDAITFSCTSVRENTCFTSAIHRLSKGEGNVFFESLLRVKERLSEAFPRHLPEPHASFAAALLLGERTGMPADVTRAFAATSTSHIVAVSGMHVVMLSAMLMRLLQLFSLGAVMRRWIVVVFLVLFTLMIGAPASALRGLLFGLLFLVAEAAGRPKQMSMAIATTAAALLFFNPVFLLDLGFQLSFLAVIGIVYGVPIVVPYIAPFVPKRPVVIAFVELAIVAGAATLTTTPLLAATFGQLSLVSIFANILVVPFVLPATILALVVVLVALVLPPVAAIVALPLFALLQAILALVAFLARFHLATVAVASVNPIILASIYAVIFIILFFFWLRLPPWQRIHSSLAQRSPSS